MRYREIGRDHCKIHIYDETKHKVICDQDFFHSGHSWSKRKKSYATEKDMLKVFENLNLRCKSCERILRKRAGKEKECL